ncbi:NAD(P)H-dependent oxidoreductase [Longitalea luteola]|uniref:NAD(P)H-dependent oxidoreductase n=1 Tax=Longitalea luteola TaxID=2812563 RepID=UPI001A97BA11|nr:NAD(P)H-dependent oxidoreductase [Longitalea luteola]
MQTLIVVIHPDLNQSVVNKRWMNELKKYPEKYTIHDLHAEYPDEKINITKEQKLIERFDKIVFQFPFYWFNCPPFFKKWLDEVLTYGWAYGSKSGYKLQGKKIALAISAGIDEADYTAGGRYRYTMKELTAPFEITFEYVKANYQPAFVFYGMEYNARPDRIEKSVSDYLSFLESF